MHVQPYLYFDGRAEEALNYYRDALGAKITMLLRSKDCPEPGNQAMPGSENNIMHAQFLIGETAIMASDGRCLGRPDFKGFALTITAADEPEAKRVFAALSEGGTVTMALVKTFFSPCFGVVNDRFGVQWMVVVEATEA